MYVCPPLTCPSFAAVAASSGDDNGYYEPGSTAVVTCTVEAKSRPTSCGWTDPDGANIGTNLAFRFGNFSCGNFQVT